MRRKLKKLTSVCLAVIMIVSVLTVAPFTAGAVMTDSDCVSVKSGDFEYEVLDEEWFGEKTAMITDYYGNATELVIPSEIDGYDIIGISWDTFNYNTNLVSVVIPDSVIFIGAFAFSNCTSLKSITIPDSVTEIEEYAFESCTSLVSVVIPDSVVDIGEYAFYGCESLTDVTISNNVDEIGWGAFVECHKLKSVTIPCNVGYIGDYAFGYIINEYGTHYKPMDGFTIYGYTNSLAGLYAYENGFTFVSIGEVSPFIYEVLDDETAMITGYNGIESNMSIPSEIDGYTVVEIDEFAFENSTRLTSVTIPDSVAAIGSYAFSECTNLKTITIPDNVTYIGAFVFENTAWYNNQPDGVVYAGKFAYTYKGRMPKNASITLKDGTKGIAACAFEYFLSLVNVTIPDSVTYICSSAFSYCEGIESITIPDSVKEISNYVFDGCDSLADITIPDSITEIGSYAFRDCTSLESLTIPESVIKIGEGAFENTAWYNNQPDGVVYAGKVAYTYKGDMPENTSITLEDGTRGISDYAFESCEFLTSITIPDSVEYIGEYAFGYIWDEDEWWYKPVDNFTIYGYTGSLAEEYAHENGFIFISVGEAPMPSLGDVNGDGKISIDDVTDIQKYVANMLAFTENQEALADVDMDGKVSIDDVTLIQKYLAGMATI
ncbi:MAG: leucine-rich repeat protein [Ruminococcus sp.]|nr:leucine-rich repeat protein [Ruminococcus sp.]